MSILTKILVRLGLMKEPTIETITSPMAKIVSKLQTYSEAQVAQSEKDAEQAQKLKDAAEAKAKAAAEARALSDRYSTLTV